MDICFSLDTTGSMYPCLAEAKRRLRETLNQLFAEFPDLRVAIIVHGDYCDKGISYVVGYIDFTSDAQELDRFVADAGKTNGGDAPECYEYVLHIAAQNLSWDWSENKVFVLIGDDVPHLLDREFVNGFVPLNWEVEARALHSLGVTIHAVQCLNRTHASWFYRQLAHVGGGYHLPLNQFSNIIELMRAVVYKQTGDDRLLDYEKELSDNLRLNRGLADILDALLEREGSSFDTRYGAADLEAVPPGRFQVLHVDTNTGIKAFVQSTGAEFKIGRGFYELTKPELVQERKEVVLQHRLSGDMFTGKKARDMLGLPYGVRGHVDPRRLPPDIASYRVFIQSTSWNRNLVGNTLFLYESE